MKCRGRGRFAGKLVTLVTGSVWVSVGVLGELVTLAMVSLWASVGPVWPHIAPQIVFKIILALIWGVILSPKSVKNGAVF